MAEQVPMAEQKTRVQLCGRLSVELDGAQVADRLRGPQVRALLVYLVLNRHRVLGRSELIGTLWAERRPASEEAALRTILSRLRAALGAGAVSGRQELTLSLPEPVWVDFEAAGTELRRASQALEQSDPRGAWALAQIPLNIAGRGLVPGLNASWLEPFRRELEDIRLEALEVIGGAGLSMGGGQLASVERSGRALIEADPFRESGYVLLMQAAARRGNTAEAVRVFERLRTLMRDELGTAPSAAAIAAYERLLSSEPLPAPMGDASGRSESAIALPEQLRSRGHAPLVGREAELRELSRLWAATSGSEPAQPGGSSQGRRVAVLVGDPGVGKTRLATRLAEEAHRGGAVVLAGQAAEEGLAPYQPLLEALRHYFVAADLDQVGMAIREYGPELARLVPDLRRRVPSLPKAQTSDPDAERYRLFEAVVGLLSAISERAPILLVLDDLHWADRPTLLLLRHLARAPAPSRLLILISYRTEATAEALRDLLADLSREQLVTEVRMAGLNRRHTAQLVALQAGEPPSRSLIEALHEETEGNPLFVEEIVRSLTHAGRRVSTATAADLRALQLPEGVKRLIARRIDLLDPGAVQWLRVAAVIGREFELEVLDEITELSEEDSLRALEAALQVGIVTESPAEPGGYSFAHALIRDALYEGMSASRRARLHARVAAVLEARSAPPRMLAHHFTQAASPAQADKAIDYAMQAAAEATALLAHEEAVTHYVRALDVLRRGQPDAQELRLELQLLLGEAGVRAGERERFREVFFQAAALAEKLDDPASLARAAVGAARRYIQPPGVIDNELIALLEQALEHSPAEPSLQRVQLLSRLTGAVSYSPRREQMHRLSQQALEVAEQLEDPLARAYALSARRSALWDPGHLSERIDASTELLRAALDAGNAELRLQGHAWLVVDLLEAGDRDGFEAQVEAFERAADQVGQPFYWWQAALWRSMRAFLAGRLDQAEELAAEALAIGMPAEPVTAAECHSWQLLSIRRQQDRGDELVEPIGRLVRQDPGSLGWRLSLALLMLEAGRYAEAQAGLDLITQRDLAEIPRDGRWMTIMSWLAELATGLGDEPRAQQLYDALLPSAGANVVVSLGVMCRGPVSRYLGKLAAALGLDEAAGEHFQRAVAAAEELGSPLWKGLAQLDHAESLKPSSPRRRELVGEVARTAKRLRLPALARRAERLTTASGAGRSD
jgi:DNA-binding SARP family transcriptional activator/tetratricopeptide (TPR) repeat protein